MFGAVQFEDFQPCRLPQKAASAWSKVGELIGCKYTPLLFVGTQITRGTNYVFIAEKETISAKPFKNLVTVVINEINSEYEIVDIETLL